MLNHLQTNKIFKEETKMAITLEELAKEVQKLKDIEEIKVLKARYSAMCDDNHNWTLIKELFAPDAQWVGDPTQPWGGGSNREEIEKLFQFYQTQMDGVPLKGVLGHNPMAPQITVADDGVHATGKWNMFGAFRMFEGRAKTGSKSFLEQGKYNDEYVKIDENGNLDPNGKWFISKLSFYDTLCAAPQDGWDDEVIQW